MATVHIFLCDDDNRWIIATWHVKRTCWHATNTSATGSTNIIHSWNLILRNSSASSQWPVLLMFILVRNFFCLVSYLLVLSDGTFQLSTYCFAEVREPFWHWTVNTTPPALSSISARFPVHFLSYSARCGWRGRYRGLVVTNVRKSSCTIVFSFGVRRRAAALHSTARNF